MDAFYKKSDGQFHLHDRLVKHKDGVPMREGGNFLYGEEHSLIHSSTDVAVAYCHLPDRIHIFTHGTAEGMGKWVEAHNAHSPHKASLHVLGQDVPVEVLNRAIVDGNFLATLLV